MQQQQQQQQQQLHQQQQQQQHLMQMQPMMPSAYYPNNVTTDHIQQYLDENKSLILKIVESQNSGKMSECAENQARLQRNLMYLAAIADSQPQPPALQAQFAPSGVMQPGSLYMQHPQSQQMTPQSLMAARSSMLYNTQQQPYSTLQQQQSFHSQLGMSSGLHMLQGNVASSTPGFSEFGRESGGEGLLGSARGSGEGRIGQHSGGSHSSDGN
uniref:SS18 N-terminal domain-containing protein n=1 Tax=Kalanchoe fedtschenkoi TaxID=63787 RepID=A0A7N0U0B4_KALFE